MKKIAMLLLLFLLIGCGDGGETAVSSPTSAPDSAETTEKIVEDDIEPDEPEPTATAEPETAVEPTEIAPTEPAEPTMTAEQESIQPAEEVADSSITEVETAVSTSSTLTPLNPADFPEELALASGSTYFTVADALAVQYGDAGGGFVSVASGGASSAVLRLCEQIADGAVVHRPLNESEREICEASGAQVIEFVIGNNTTVVLIHPNNDWATNMTLDELRLAFTSAETWADINPAWPNSPIQRYLPSTDSGIFNNFVSLVFDGDESGVLAASALNLSEDNSVLLAGLESSVDGLALINLAFVEGRGGGGTAVFIDGIAPAATDYLLNSPVNVVTLDIILAEKPQVAAFMNFMLINSGQIVQDTGFLSPIDAATQQTNDQAWLDTVRE